MIVSNKVYLWVLLTRVLSTAQARVAQAGGGKAPLKAVEGSRVRKRCGQSMSIKSLVSAV